MISFAKVVPGDPGYLADYPQQCICGSQKGPMVATGKTYRTAPGVASEVAGHVYLCRLCVTQSARALGLVKGDEHERLQHAADELAQAQLELQQRQEIVERLERVGGEQRAKINSQAQFIETLQGDLTRQRVLANQVATTAGELAAV